MSYKELEVGYQGLRAASFYIGDDSDCQVLSDLALEDTLPTTYDYVYTSANSPTRTIHPNCPSCMQGGIDCSECPDGEMLLMDVDKEKGDSGKQVLVGICAMAKKSNSKPMKEILARLEFEYIQTVIFS